VLQIEDLDQAEITANLDGLSFSLEKLQAAREKDHLVEFWDEHTGPLTIIERLLTRRAEMK
jgi:hypothetical protein